MLHHLIHVNYATILLTVFMIIFLFSNTAFTKRISRLFFISTFCVFLLVIADSVETWTASFSEPHPLRIWVSALGYTLRPIGILNIIFILVRSKDINRHLLILPAVINGIISYSALFTELSFSYSSDNQFVRGPLGLSAYVVGVFYLVILLVITIRYLKERNHYESMIVFFIVFVAVLSIYLEVAFAFDGFINAAFAVSITFYYLFFHAQTFKRDVLTQAFNRRCFYDDAHQNFSKLKAVISIDLNDLKLLNDNKGHSSGDAALCSIVHSIKKVLPSGCNLYRTGGDEFMVLCFKYDPDTLEDIVIQMKEEISKTPYKCAMGLALLNENEDLDHVCARADAIMYEDKAKIKGTRPR